MTSPLREILLQLLEPCNSEPARVSVELSMASAEAAFGAMMDGDANDAEIAALLVALRIRGESIETIAGAAEAMAARATMIPCRTVGLLDTCGTGGDELQTFNISTAAALVAAAVGVPVAKHGNRSVSSSSGSADVLEQLGVKIQLSPEAAARCVDEVGIGFCFAQQFHTAMKFIAPVRRQLGVRTIFNLIGPLVNPANAAYQLIGTVSPAVAAKLAGAIRLMNRQQKINKQEKRKRVAVVCGNSELDEVCLWGPTDVWWVNGETISQEQWTPDDFGLPMCDVRDVQVSSSAESAALIRQLFDGNGFYTNTGNRQLKAAHNLVVANAAAALLVAEKVTDLRDGVTLANDAILSGKVAETVEQLVRVSLESC